MQRLRRMCQKGKEQTSKGATAKPKLGKLYKFASNVYVKLSYSHTPITYESMLPTIRDTGQRHFYGRFLTTKKKNQAQNPYAQMRSIGSRGNMQ